MSVRLVSHLPSPRGTKTLNLGNHLLTGFSAARNNFAIGNTRMGVANFSFLAQQLPGFKVNGSQVSVLLEPKDFYEELLKRSGLSKSRIVLAALYLGTAKREKALVAAIEDNLTANQDLRVKILLDWCRGTRVTGGQSSASVLSNIAKEDAKRAGVWMYHTPHLRGITKSITPAKLNETIGLQHCKVYIFDDSLIISGANLSNDYFDNRQDRYILIENCPQLADYYEGLVSTIAEFSFRLDANQTFLDPQQQHEMKTKESQAHIRKDEPRHDPAPHPYQSRFQDFVSWTQTRVESFLNESRRVFQVGQEVLGQSVVNSTSSSTGIKGIETSSNTTTAFDDCSKTTSADNIETTSVDNTTTTYRDDSQDGEFDTYIFPSIQMGPFNIKQDSEITSQLLRTGQEGGKFYFGSGYFNLTEEYLHEILHGSKSHFEIVMAHPKANGFLGARFPLGGIPHAYTYIAKNFCELVKARNMHDRIKLFEYQRPGWTFHAKGLWYYSPGTDLPCLTMVGSPNFGYRSVYKDLETQITIVTRNAGLARRLDEERRRIFQESLPANADVFEKAERAVPTWVRMVVGIARHYF